MKFQKTFLFIIILPLTLILDLLMFAFTRNCPSCGSFIQFLTSEGALSFPIVVGFSEWMGQFISVVLRPKTEEL